MNPLKTLWRRLLHAENGFDMEPIIDFIYMAALAVICAAGALVLVYLIFRLGSRAIYFSKLEYLRRFTNYGKSSKEKQV